MNRKTSEQSLRGTGRTTNQMLEAPQGSLFVWCNSQLWYPQKLAQVLRRTDLIIVAPHTLCENMMGRIYSAVILDHAGYEMISPQQFHWLEAMQMQVRMRIERDAAKKLEIES